MTDLRYAVRMLLKSPGFSATAIFALALGIGATTAMFGVIYAFLLRPLPFADSDKLVMLQSRSTKTNADLGVSYLDFKDSREQAQSFSDVAFFNLRWNGNLRADGGAAQTLKTTLTTANLFTLLGVEPMLGRNFLPSDDEPSSERVMLISHRVWQQTFGGANSILGRPVVLDGDAVTVIGVMPPGFRFPVQSDVWVPSSRIFTSSATTRSWRADQVIGRVKDGVSLQQAEAELRLIAERIAAQHPDTNAEVGAAVMPLRQHWTGDLRGSLVVLLAACGGVLAIACANVGQLLLARASSRQRELLVRAALGATRARLARQLLTESTLIALLGSFVGVVFAYWLVDLVAVAIPVELPFWIRFDVNPAVLAFTVFVSFVCGVAAGSLPAWSTTRVDVSEALKRSGAGNTGATESSGRLRDLLTAAQVAVSVVLLVGASLVLRSVLNLRDIDPGFDPGQVLLMEVNPTYRSSETRYIRADRYSRLLDRIARIPGVAATAANNSPPFIPQRPWNRAEFTADGQAIDEQARNPRANFQTVSPDYFRLLGIPLLRGRTFDARDNMDAPRVCVVSETLAARLWPGQDALGKRLLLGKPDHETTADEWMTIVGVTRDVRHQALDREAGPDVYNCSQQLAWKQMHFLVRAQDGVAPMSLAEPLRHEIAAAEPEVGVFNFTALEAEVANSLWQPRFRAWLLSFFSGVALLLAATGLYGVVAYRVTQRTREIGIRIALGATRAAIAQLMLRSSLRAVAIGLVLGLMAAWVLARLLRASLISINAADLASYAVACAALAFTATFACWLPTRRATRVDPITALRSE
jgi:putative ABC transport system permease protein